jgi:hypothetical protein
VVVAVAGLNLEGLTCGGVVPCGGGGCFQVHGFQGNMEDYYHPDNSCINRVLETKKGAATSTGSTVLPAATGALIALLLLLRTRSPASQ